MNRTIKKLLGTRAAAHTILSLVRWYLLLIRVRVENESQWISHLEKGGSVILCAFHQQIFSFVRHFPLYLRFDPMIMISLSRDGNIGTSIADIVGVKVTRGSRSRGGREAMNEMIRHLEKGGRLGANIVDGPTGPIGKVKPGTLRIAQKSGSEIVPAFAIPESAWFLKSWDRFMIPKPFTRVTLRFGNRIKADAIGSREDFERLRLHLESLMAPYLYNGPGKKGH